MKMKQVKFKYATSHAVEYNFRVEPKMTADEQEIVKKACNFPFSFTLEVSTTPDSITVVAKPPMFETPVEDQAKFYIKEIQEALNTVVVMAQ
jgi:hypothetical protein